jgi:hypothetical protein
MHSMQGMGLSPIDDNILYRLLKPSPGPRLTKSPCAPRSRLLRTPPKPRRPGAAIPFLGQLRRFRAVGYERTGRYPKGDCQKRTLCFTQSHPELNNFSHLPNPLSGPSPARPTSSRTREFVRLRRESRDRLLQVYSLRSVRLCPSSVWCATANATS